MAIDEAKMIREGRADQLEHAKRHLPVSYWIETEPARATPRKASAAEEEFLSAALMARRFMEIIPQPQPPFELDGNTTYSPDFLCKLPSGHKLYVEVKGRKMVSEALTRMKLRQCSERYPEHTWWLARWSPRCPWKVQEVVNGVIKRKAIEVPWLS